MFLAFKTYPDGSMGTINTSQVTTVGPDPRYPTMTLIRFADGREIVVAEPPRQVMDRLSQSETIRQRRKI